MFYFIWSESVGKHADTAFRFSIFGPLFGEGAQVACDMFLISQTVSSGSLGSLTLHFLPFELLTSFSNFSLPSLLGTHVFVTRTATRDSCFLSASFWFRLRGSSSVANTIEYSRIETKLNQSFLETRSQVPLLSMFYAFSKRFPSLSDGKPSKCAMTSTSQQVSPSSPEGASQLLCNQASLQPSKQPTHAIT